MDGGERRPATTIRLLVDEDVKEEGQRACSVGYWKFVIFNFFNSFIGKKKIKKQK